jgi:hypothetical protein
MGAVCACCHDRRIDCLRYYELMVRSNAPGGRWVVLCHNCSARADKLKPPPRSIEGLVMRLGRDRRWGDRRAESVGRTSPRAAWLERRAGDRRVSERGAMDATDLAEIVIEMEADFEIEVDEQSLAEIGEVTGVFTRLPEG